MGNCIEVTSKHTPQSDEIRSHIEQDKSDQVEKNCKMRVKIVMRKEELELLLLQLNRTDGKRPLEDVLGEIERRRAKAKPSAASAWRPCLDSILETDTPHEEITTLMR